MGHRYTWLVGIVFAACASSTPGTQPHDMSEAAHEQQAAAHAQEAAAHAAQVDADARALGERCRAARRGEASTPPGLVCWTSVVNPTDVHRQQAEEHRRLAEAHRAASASLRAAEARACAGISPADRDASPFERVEDIASVAPYREDRGTPRSPRLRTAGAIVTFRAVPGMTAEWLQRLVDCHLARNAALGHQVPEMPACPLVPKGVTARVESTGDGFAVIVRADDEATAREVLARAERLVAPR
jgi:hypothetical protein